LIVAAAVLASCETLYSEDLQHGQLIGGISVVNPFLNKENLGSEFGVTPCRIWGHTLNSELNSALKNLQKGRRERFALKFDF
jgi:hypothetical protein